MSLTPTQLDRIEQLRLEWGLADQQVRSAVTGWATSPARAGVEQEFYRRLNDICDPEHDLSYADTILAGQRWWYDVKREAFLNLREEISA